MKIDAESRIEKQTGVQDIQMGIPDTFPFRPNRDWLIVQLENVRDKTASGMLYVPDVAKEAPSIGRVLAAGPGVSGEVPMTSKVDDRILFAKYAGFEIDWEDGKTYLFVRDSEVVAYVNEGGGQCQM